MAVQLRRYEIADGRMDDMVAWFPSVIPVREKYGYTVEFAYADREANQFVWAVSYPGSVEDFEAALDGYNDSPERAQIFADFESPVTGMHVAFVDSAI